jgi:hypothetical protein
MVSQPLADGAAVRKPYVRALLQHDPGLVIDGGELLPMGQEDILSPVRAVVRQLPTDVEVTEVSQQPVVVRRYAEANGVTILVVNASPWQAQADITLELPQAATMVTLEGDPTGATPATPPRSLAAGRQAWTLPLEPYAIHAVRIDSEAVKIAEVHAKLGETALAELKAQLDNLENRDLTAPRVYPRLNNASFEPVGGAGPLAGWQLASTTASIELDATHPQDGQTCLYFRNDAGPAVLHSDPFPMPQTGQLALTVHLRDQRLQPATDLRIVIESADQSHVYRRAATVAAASDPLKPGQWQYKAILINDLPLESRGEMRLRLELTGPGEIWIDSMKLYDLLFPLKFYKFEAAENLQFVQLRHAAKSAYDEGRVADCVRQLERYWPRFLTEYTPLIQPAIVKETPQTPDQPPPKQAQQPAPGLGERLRSVFPFAR